MKRWHIVFLAAVFLIGMSVVMGYRAGVRLLQDSILDALGSRQRHHRGQGELVFSRSVWGEHRGS